MLRRIGLVFGVTLLGVSMLGTVKADQCWSISVEQTDKALAALQVGDVIVQYCEPCRTVPPEKITIRSLNRAKGLINGRALDDIAYLFVPEHRPVPASGPARFVNLAKIAGCPTSDVSPALEFDLSKIPERNDPTADIEMGEEDLGLDE